MKPKYLLALAACMLLMFSCQGKRQAPSVGEVDLADSVALAPDTVATDTMEQLITEMQMPKAADELFDDFIFNFAANQKLQRARIVFPLKVHRQGAEETIPEKKWKTERFFMRQGYYTLLFDSEEQLEVVKDTSVSQAIVEKVFFERKCVEQYMFSRQRGVWMLREVREVPITEHPEASFLTFYEQFATDETFQLQSLSETVLFVGPDPDDDFSQMEGVITPDTWGAFAPELPTGMIYNIVYGPQQPPSHQKVFVMRGIANGFEVEMVFRQRAGRWRLVKMTT